MLWLIIRCKTSKNSEKRNASMTPSAGFVHLDSAEELAEVRSIR